jgi:isoquinoline 1-oxidoreductase beta subunit
MTDTLEFTRRDFLRAGAAVGAGLVIAVQRSSAQRIATTGSIAGGSATAAPLAPSVYLQVSPDGTVSVWVSKSEMGQGVRTALPMIVAEELDADWSTIRVIQADVDPKYGDMSTGGSDSVHSMWAPLRKAGAQAREMLVAAAAQTWGVSPSACRTENGAVLHDASGRRAAYATLAVLAATLPVPAEPVLKNPRDFKIIGRSTPSLDIPSKVDGTARYGIDTVVPGMTYAVIARCPVFGGRMAGYDAAKAKAVPGVLQVIEVPTGVAVIATGTWAAIQGSRALACRWDEDAATKLDSASIDRMLRSRGEQPGAMARNDGNASAAYAKAAVRLDATYDVPFLAHATMEPLNCVADVRADRAEIWAPNQIPDWAARAVSETLGLKPEAITVHVVMMGGGFGRRLLPEYVVEAAQVSRAAGVPVKVVWTREDDMQHDWYRPISHHRLSGALDAKGVPVSWSHRVVAPSITGYRWPGSVSNGFDDQAVDGAQQLPYEIPNLRVEYCMFASAVPVSWWRSVYASQNAFANEGFVDELAHAAKRDPVEFRRALLSKLPRHRAVLDLAAEKSGWGTPLPAGRGRGIAIHHFFSDTIVAEVAEVSVGRDGAVRVHRAQLEGGVVYGLSAALHGAITIERGRVAQSNFHDYPVLRMPEMPAIEVYIVPSDAPPMGAGEPGVPPIAPAVANAIFAATGKRVRSLPIRL